MAIVQYYVDAESVNMETELCEITDDEKYTLDNNSYEKDSSGVDLECCISECAEDYHNHHGGWEVPWPVCFIVWIDNVCKGKFSVECEFNPVFSAKKVEP
ncbi:hypothetical protein [Providencia rustigianii]|uniref:hypothetical protein n=1 Tax=Providencia rustigianii TaxID=158850 RepID=UPI00223E9FCB|nr:hypothetical protein [Providencia rustigianii]